MPPLRQATANPCPSCSHNFLHAKGCTTATPGTPISTCKPYPFPRRQATFNWPADSADN